MGLRLARAFGAALALGFVLAVAQPAQATALSALVFLAQPRDVVSRTAPPKPAHPIDASRVPILATPRAAKMLRPFLGRQMGPELLAQLRAAMQAYFVALRQPYASIVFPAQDVTGGVLQVLVTEGRIGRIRVDGNTYFSTRQYLAALHVQPGQIPDSAKLDAGIDWLNQNPYRHATLQASAGAFEGTTDLTVEAQDRIPISFYAGVDNTGNASTGLTRMDAGFDWGNAFDRGDDLTYTYETTPDNLTVRQHELSYTTSAAASSSFTFSADYATTHAPNGAITTTGLSEGLSLRFVTALAPGAAFTQQLDGGADYKSTNNNLLFGGLSVFPTRSEIYDLTVGYGATWKQGDDATTAGLSVYVSPGGLSGGDTDAAFASQQAGAQANYAYGNASLQRSVALAKGMSWSTRVELQVSDAILLSSEQLDFGGYGSIRGFPSSFATRDEGVLASTQLGFRPLRLGLPEAAGLARSDGLAPYVFVDYGNGWNHAEINGVDTDIQLVTAGPGFSYQMGKLVTGRFDYGFVLDHAGLPAPGGQADLALQFRT